MPAAMGDEVDRAAQETEAWLREAIEAASRGVWRPQPTGACHWCGYKVAAPSALFCSAECRVDAEKRRAADLRAGRGRRI